ncbi:PorT family protein [Pontibacter ruber]|uniref:PorT family protein n=1 Tax=Pontibacter ruber TaxID=1343895 RepID=A0ABW5D1S5_9BACT|nr:PorT family protein [Pontibacter ruber]
MKLTFTFLLSLTCALAFAQKNYVQGHYITHQGDTVQVHINDQNWDRNPQFIEVKREAHSSDVQKLKVTDIKGFSLSSGDKYESYIVDVDRSPNKLHQLESITQPVVERDTVFLRALVLGKANLYSLKDERAKEHYYLKTGEEEPVELIYRVSMVEDGNRTGYTQLPIYRGMLIAKLTGCPEVSGKIARVEFKANALQRVVQEYNACVIGTDGNYATAEEKVKLNLLAIGGVSYTSLKFSGSGFNSLLGEDFTGGNYNLGFSLLATLPRARGKWALRNDLTYHTLKTEGLYEEGSNVGQENYTKVETTFDMGYVGLSTSVRYKLLEAGIKPYIHVGMANNFMVKNSSNQKSFRRYYGIERTKEESPLNDFRKYEQALFVGAGMQIKKVVAEIKYESGNAFSIYKSLASSRNTLTFQLGYVLR